MRIDLDKMKEDCGQKTYELRVKGKTYEFKIDLNALEKIEEKMGEPAPVIFARLMITERTYNYLVEIISAIIGVPDLEKNVRWTAKNIANLDNILKMMAYEQVDNDSVDRLCERIIKSASKFDKIG